MYIPNFIRRESRLSKELRRVALAFRNNHHAQAASLIAAMALVAFVIFPSVLTTTHATQDQLYCSLYGVHDESSSDSQFFSIAFDTNTATLIGQEYDGLDVEAIAIHPDTDTLYAVSGEDNSDSFLYTVDKISGALVLIGQVNSGVNHEFVAATFHPDGTLWASQEDVGLYTINISTGQATLEFEFSAVKDNWEGLAWNSAGTLLYGTSGTTLYEWDPTTQSVTELCDGFVDNAIEALEMHPDGRLLAGMHNASTGFQIFEIHPNSCTTSDVEYTLPAGLDDIESFDFSSCVTKEKPEEPVTYQYQNTCTDDFGYKSVVAGIGLQDNSSGTITINVPGAVERAWLYWNGFDENLVGDNTAVLNGVPVSGLRLAANMDDLFAYRADITPFVLNGSNTFLVSDIDMGPRTNGAGIVVVYKDPHGAPSYLSIIESAEFFWKGMSDSALRDSSVYTFSFNRSDANRTALYQTMLGGADHDRTYRHGNLWFSTQTSNPLVDNVLASEIATNYTNAADGAEWDTYSTSVTIPAAATFAAFQAESPEDQDGDSLVMTIQSFTLPVSCPIIDECIDNTKPVPVITPKNETIALGENITLSASLSYDPDGDEITEYLWAVNQLNLTGTDEIFTFTPPELGDYIVTLKAADACGYDVTWTTVTVVEPDMCHLSITKTDDKVSAEPGEALTYTISLENTGTANCTGGGVELREFYDELTNFVSSTPEPTANNDYWNFDVMEPGESHAVIITTTVSDTAQAGDTLHNVACVWAAELGDYNDPHAWVCDTEDTPVVEPPNQCIDNQAPTANAGEDQSTTVGAIITLDGSQSSDPDNDTLSYHWSIPELNLTFDTSHASVTFSEIGVYEAELTVSDACIPSTDSALITVTNGGGTPCAGNNAPIPVIIPQNPSGFVGEQIEFDAGSSTDSDNDTLQYEWQVNGVSVATTQIMKFIPTLAGNKTITLVVSDQCTSAEIQTHLTVNPPQCENHTNPVAVITPLNETAELGSTVTFNASGSTDADNDALSYLWKVNGVEMGASETFEYVPANSGTYSVNLTVIDICGTHTAETNLAVNTRTSSCAGNNIPIAHAGADIHIKQGDSVTLDAGATTDPDNDALTYMWKIEALGLDFTGKHITFDLNQSGSFTVQLTVNDGCSESVDYLTINADQIISGGCQEGCGGPEPEPEPEPNPAPPGGGGGGGGGTITPNPQPEPEPFFEPQVEGEKEQEILGVNDFVPPVVSPRAGARVSIVDIIIGFIVGFFAVGLFIQYYRIRSSHNHNFIKLLDNQSPDNSQAHVYQWNDEDNRTIMHTENTSYPQPSKNIPHGAEFI